MILKERIAWDKYSEEFKKWLTDLERYPAYASAISYNLLKYSRGITLEVGSGSGRNSLFLARVGRFVVLLDFSLKAMKFSKELFLKNNLPGNFIVADACHLPFRENVFDFIFADSSLEHIKNYVKAFHQMISVLKLNG